MTQASDDLPDRLLVCEGPCNPDLEEYDAAQSRAAGVMTSLDIRGRRSMRVGMKDWGRQLKHTAHIPAGPMVYRTGPGWVRPWVCSVCGHRRYH